MIEINLKIENQLLKRVDKEPIVDHSKNIVKTKFTIEGDLWDDLDKFVIFTDAFDNKTTVHLGFESVCECVVPSSCLKTSYFKMVIYGGDRTITNQVTIPLLESGYTRKHHDSDIEPKDIFVELFEGLNSKLDNIMYADNCLHLFKNGVLVNSISLPFVEYSQVKSIVIEQIREYMDSDELNRFLKEQGYINQVYMVGDDLIFE